MFLTLYVTAILEGDVDPVADALVDDRRFVKRGARYRGASSNFWGAIQVS